MDNQLKRIPLTGTDSATTSFVHLRPNSNGKIDLLAS